MSSVVQVDIGQWNNWLRNRDHLAGKLGGANQADLDTYFLKTHAASEALFRRFLFIGLRLNRVTFDEASDWLSHNDTTPSRLHYGAQFDRLYAHICTFDGLLNGSAKLADLWRLWNDFSKIIRNHIAHGMRAYADEWLICAVRVDQSLMVELDAAMAYHLGGSGAGNLKLLSPRLPKGKIGVNIPALLGRAKGKIKPNASLQGTQACLKLLKLWP